MQSENTLITDSNLNPIQGVGNKIYSGRTTVNSTSVPVLLLPAGLKTIKVILKGTTGNTGNIAVGGQTVTSTGFYLDADQSVELTVDNSLCPLFGLAVSTTTDTVHWIAIGAE